MTQPRSRPPLHTTIDADLLKRLKAHCVKHRISMSLAAETALTKYLEDFDEQRHQ